jgi:hypothetical protein
VCLPAVDERLRAECKLLQALGALGCKACGSSLARSVDAVQMSEEGISACYVNSHSFVHDIVTLSQVRGRPHGVRLACSNGGLSVHTSSAVVLKPHRMLLACAGVWRGAAGGRPRNCAQLVPR